MRASLQRPPPPPPPRAPGRPPPGRVAAGERFLFFPRARRKALNPRPLPFLFYPRSAGAATDASAENLYIDASSVALIKRCAVFLLATETPNRIATRAKALPAL